MAKRIAVSVVIVLCLVGCGREGSGDTSTTGTTSPDSTTTSTTASTSTTVADSGHQLADSINTELQAELLEMLAEDQAVRTGVAPPGDDRTPEELFDSMSSVDRANTARMKEIFEEYGWPGWSLVGEDGSEAAWALTQHADLNPDVQKRGLELLKAAVAMDDASKGDLAYLTDRVLVGEGKPQLYGTQVSVDQDGELMPQTPIEDPDNVNKRRAEMGLGTLEEYYEEFRSLTDETIP